MSWLIIVANFVKIFHEALVFLLMGVFVVWDFHRTLSLRGYIFVIEYITAAYLKGRLSADCPFRVFEFCLRGLGGQHFDLNRFHTMTELSNRGMEASQIYRTLLWQSGLHILMLAILMAAGAILVDGALQKVIRTP